MIIIIDSGSTQTRLYLLRDEEIVAEHLLAVGVNSGKARSQGNFRDAIAAGISELLHANQLTTGDVRFAIASGMITSNLGLLEIPHITAPVSLEQLVSRVVKVKDPAILPLDLEIRFVPGIKNSQADRSWSSLRDIDLMRGEETQAVG
jgi:2-dehydro-3-deoxygalactonokinase